MGGTPKSKFLCGTYLRSSSNPTTPTPCPSNHVGLLRIQVRGINRVTVRGSCPSSRSQATITVLLRRSKLEIQDSTKTELHTTCSTPLDLTMADENQKTPKEPQMSPIERRNSLEKHLQHRPDVQDLKDRHILLDTTAAP